MHGHVHEYFLAVVVAGLYYEAGARLNHLAAFWVDGFWVGARRHGWELALGLESGELFVDALELGLRNAFFLSQELYVLLHFYSNEKQTSPHVDARLPARALLATRKGVQAAS